MAPGKFQRAISDEQERQAAIAETAALAATGIQASEKQAPKKPAPGAAKPRSRAARVRDKLKAKAKPPEIRGPSPNSATNLIIADVALRGGAAIARRAMEQAVLGKAYTPRKAKAILDGRSFGESIAHGLLARVALNSVPGAIAVVGGLAIKTLYDRSRARKARASGERQLAEMAEDGTES